MIMESESKQHVQLPNDMTITKILTPRDLLVYVCIKSFMNKDTLECFPSLATIVNLSGISKPTVMKSIKLLESENYISVRKEGRKNIYKFNPHKNFEPFSYDFLNNKDITSSEKAMYTALQQNLIKDVTGFGKTTYDYFEISEKINMPYKTVLENMKSLEKKGLLDIVKTNKKDPVTGVMKQEKIFHLDELGQAIVFTLQNHEDRINDNTSDIKTLQKQVNILIKENRELKKVIEDKNLEKDTNLFEL